MSKESIVCPHVGKSGCCDDCTLNLEPITCEEELREYEVNQ